MSRTTGPLCWQHGDHVGQQGQSLQGRGVAGLGLAGRAQRFQGFLPSDMLIPVQPKPICNEGVESLKHKQEALSKKASSVLLCRCNHVKKNKTASPPAKEQALTLTALELPPTLPALQEAGMELVPQVSALYVTQSQALGPAGPSSQQSSSGSPPLTHPTALHQLPGPPAAQSHQCSLWSRHPP